MEVAGHEVRILSYHRSIGARGRLRGWGLGREVGVIR